MDKIIIYSPSFNIKSGGIIALHKLCDILITLGYNTYLHPMENPFYINENYKYQVINKEEIDLNNDVILYPEIIWGNPLNGKNIIRYIMNNGHITLGRKETWGEEDFWLYYSELFYDGIKNKNILTVIDSFLDLYKDYNLERTIESCHTYRKNDNPTNKVHNDDSIEINFNHNPEDLVTIFNNCKRFYSYDNKTYLNTIAALCGCESIIVTEEDNFEKYINNSPSVKYGIAYGFDDLERAKNTLPLLRKHIENLEKEPYNKIPELINKINEYFKTNITN
jgi:hypothetical protein